LALWAPLTTGSGCSRCSAGSEQLPLSQPGPIRDGLAGWLVVTADPSTIRGCGKAAARLVPMIRCSAPPRAVTWIRPPPIARGEAYRSVPGPAGRDVRALGRDRRRTRESRLPVHARCVRRPTRSPARPIRASTRRTSDPAVETAQNGANSRHFRTPGRAPPYSDILAGGGPVRPRAQC
jgi:hypothetical protein